VYNPARIMGRIDINLPDDLENKLRMEAGRRLGARRGSLTDAIVDAIETWLDEDEDNEPKQSETRRKR
jgi:metal-responsive CopG/Arc/MetJ family transcriptional regulator